MPLDRSGSTTWTTQRDRSINHVFHPGFHPPGRRQQKPVTAQYLENAALYYLQRFASSSANLRRVLMGKVERSARAHGTDRSEGAALVEALIERYQRSGCWTTRPMPR